MQTSAMDDTRQVCEREPAKAETETKTEMEEQPERKRCKGHIELSAEKVAWMDAFTACEHNVAHVVGQLRASGVKHDPRHLQIGITDLQKAFMSLRRALAMPKLPFSDAYDASAPVPVVVPPLSEE